MPRRLPPALPAEIGALLRRGTVIPAHPLALDERRRLDERRERALARYYLDAGSGGPAVGGIALPAQCWRRFAGIENVVAIKIAPFNRYATLDVIKGVVAARAEDRIALSTGNDGHIVLGLAVAFDLQRADETVCVRIRGGLLGHWSAGTKKAVEISDRVQRGPVDENLLALDSRVTDCNDAFFGAANDFAGCIPGCHEVLRRQGPLAGTGCLVPDEKRSPGQSEEIDRVYRVHGDLCDDALVRANLDRWLS
jgi:hypothetical protein